LIKPFST